MVQEIDADDGMYQRLMAPIWEKLYRWQQDRELSPSQRALLEDQISQEVLKEVVDQNEEVLYEVVEDEVEFMALAKVFTELVDEDTDIEY